MATVLSFVQSLGGWAYGLAALLSILVFVSVAVYLDQGPSRAYRGRDAGPGVLALLVACGLLFLCLVLAVSHLRDLAGPSPAEQQRKRERAEQLAQYEQRASEDRIREAATLEQLAAASECVKEELKRTLSRGSLISSKALAQAERSCTQALPPKERSLLESQWRSLDRT